MKFTPHPSTLAKVSSATGKRLQTSDLDDAGRRRSKTSRAQDYVAKNIAGYRFPDGRTSTAHDMYDPSFPEGAEPGMVDVLYKAKFYPNDTSGYEAQILEFRSIEDLEAQGVSVDMTAVALVHDADGKDVLIIARDEDDLASQIDDASATSIKRASIKIPENLEGDLQFFFASSAAGGVEIHAADSEDKLSDMLRDRFSFLDIQNDGLEGVLDAIWTNTERPEITWRIAYGEKSDEPEFEPGY